MVADKLNTQTQLQLLLGTYTLPFMIAICIYLDAPFRFCVGSTAVQKHSQFFSVNTFFEVQLIMVDPVWH